MAAHLAATSDTARLRSPAKEPSPTIIAAGRGRSNAAVHVNRILPYRRHT
jgi:hypothetical protein